MPTLRFYFRCREAVSVKKTQQVFAKRCPKRLIVLRVKSEWNESACSIHENARAVDFRENDVPHRPAALQSSAASSGERSSAEPIRGSAATERAKAVRSQGSDQPWSEQYARTAKKSTRRVVNYARSASSRRGHKDQPETNFDTEISAFGQLRERVAGSCLEWEDFSTAPN